MGTPCLIPLWHHACCLYTSCLCNPSAIWSCRLHKGCVTKPYTPEEYNLYHLVHYCVLSISTCPVQKKHPLNILQEYGNLHHVSWHLNNNKTTQIFACDILKPTNSVERYFVTIVWNPKKLTCICYGTRCPFYETCCEHVLSDFPSAATVWVLRWRGVNSVFLWCSCEKIRLTTLYSC